MLKLCGTVISSNPVSMQFVLNLTGQHLTEHEIDNYVDLVSFVKYIQLLKSFNNEQPNGILINKILILQVIRSEL